MLDEAEELAQLAVALGEAQNAQNVVEGNLVSAYNKINTLEKERIALEERILQLEIANVNMDMLLQENRVDYKPADRG